ncbi:dienelactone hydrolase family protein [Phenylobacterium sp.]|uniref:dienelactone hydrolase family protein n=1 Tax=Phenylobacterium sp. TaxID=1871053 RepID=UPI0035B18D52
MQPPITRVRIPPLQLEADLQAAPLPRGLVIFAHGSGSSRRSPRNQAVAQALVASGLASLLMDLLTQGEEAERANIFDMPLLGERLVQAIDWASNQPALAHLPIGLFGASTGAGAALRAAAARPARVRAVVSRGGRPDLAGAALPDVQAPTLLVVGGRDEAVIALNHHAAQQMSAHVELAIVPGATHLFEEPGALQAVTDLAIAWFHDHLGPGVMQKQVSRED